MPKFDVCVNVDLTIEAKDISEAVVKAHAVTVCSTCDVNRVNIHAHEHRELPVPKDIVDVVEEHEVLPQGDH